MKVNSISNKNNTCLDSVISLLSKTFDLLLVSAIELTSLCFDSKVFDALFVIVPPKVQEDPASIGYNFDGSNALGSIFILSLIIALTNSDFEESCFDCKVFDALFVIVPPKVQEDPASIGYNFVGSNALGCIFILSLIIALINSDFEESCFDGKVLDALFVIVRSKPQQDSAISIFDTDSTFIVCSDTLFLTESWIVVSTTPLELLL